MITRDVIADMMLRRLVGAVTCW